jgi:hypothetical protein
VATAIATAPGRDRLVPVNDDNACREIAEQINQARPHWLVLWGSYSRRFWAFPLFETRPRMLVHASYPGALLARLDDAERRYLIEPGEVTRDDADPR